VGRWSYSTSKAVDEILAHAYWRAKGLPTVIVRLFNTVGPRQSPEYGMVLPRFIEAALQGRVLKVHGDGSQSRCFGHVRDIVPGLMALMESREAEGLAVNLGSQEEITILELAKLVIERTGSSSEVQLVPYQDVYVGGFEDMPRRVPDITRARKLVGFEPVTSLAEIVDTMIDDARRRH
jgi:UDP-glucose 4-epimerase